jgi:hypothetical protein
VSRNSWAKAAAGTILVLVGLYAAHFTGRIKFANEHVVFSRAAVLVPFSGAVGQFVTCAYGRFWNVTCSNPEDNEAWKRAQAMNLPELQNLNVSIRYLCAADPVRQFLACSDRNMVGVAAMLTMLASVLGAAAIGLEARRLPDRTSARRALVRYGICAAACLLMLWLFRVTATTLWMAAIDERMIATRPILAFTGSVIGYGILVALAVIALVGTASSAVALARR